MGKEYYINDQTFASCTNGVLPGKIRIISADRRVNNKGFKLANIDDRFTPFSCKYAILIAVLAAVFIAALSFLAAFLIGILLGIGLCAIATYSQKWQNFHPKVIVHKKNALTDKSFINCPIGGVVTPTFSPLVACSRAGVNFASTLLDSFLLYIGGQGAVQIFKNYSLKAFAGYTTANFVINMATDKIISQNVVNLVNGENPDEGDKGPETPADQMDEAKTYVSYAGDGTPVWWKGDDGSRISRNASDYDSFRSINSDAAQAHSANADAAANTARNNTTGQVEGNRAYNSEMQRQNEQINANERAARRDYKKVYKRMAQMDGKTGKAADRQARRQAMEAARRDADASRAQAREQATSRRNQAIEQAKQSAASEARTNAMNNTRALNKQKFEYLKKASGGFLKSWGVGIGISVISGVATKQANNAIDRNAEDWQSDAIKRLGLNVAAIEK